LEREGIGQVGDSQRTFYGIPNLSWVSMSPVVFLYQGSHQVVFN
jgi:hypothetical protein